ncbi:MAG TPA: DNA repair protein RecN [Acidimicrobiia bacterium]|nr:DNA repair protein RecN [Acidimicrobiia bacterium]
MLVELHVANLGIVDDLTLLVAPGLTAITGETGAGKTLLVEAVELLLGARADASLVREGAPEARVEGRFVDDDGGERVLARVVPADGRARAYVDGRLATAGELAAVGATLVDLHGQNSHQSLLAPAVQRAALDRFAGTPAAQALHELRTARDDARAATAELASLGGDARARARELDLLRFQIDEIEQAVIDDPAEDVTLEAEEALLRDAAGHRAALAAAYDALENRGYDAVGVAASALADRHPFDDLSARLRSVLAELADIESELRLAAERVPDDPERLEAIRSRRQLLRELQRKYGDTLAEVLAFAATTRARLAELESYEERAASLEAARADADRRAAAAAARLSEIRRAAAAPLGERVSEHLSDLAMPAARISVLVEPAELTEDGADTVTFVLSANPGEPPRPLARAASGGELSRTMLALRLVLSEAPPTLVFDEVDAGLGGEAGTAVGRHLAELGRRHQVLCVTHLAQVAAHADAQVAVTKRERGGRTVTVATVVEGEDRIGELARMLAGLGSDHARRHAAELLDAARADRAPRRRRSGTGARV